MDWAFDHHTCFYRSGYDFSLPLRPKVLFPKFASTPATNRRFFLTFKVWFHGHDAGVGKHADGAHPILQCSVPHPTAVLQNSR